MKKITLVPLNHMNEAQIAIGFPYDNEIRLHIQKLGFVRWSRTHQTFYALRSTKNLQLLYEHLRKKNWYVDYLALSENPVEPAVKKPTQKNEISMQGLTGKEKGFCRVLENGCKKSA